MNLVDISVVIPVYNEESNLQILHERLVRALEQTRRSWEIIFVNDGSKDRSFDLLKAFVKERPTQIRVIDFNGNFGQHMAIIAAFEIAAGEVVVTLDADLQNPPEEIHKLLQKIDEGADYVGSYRKERKDIWIRKIASRFNNFLREKATKMRIRDQGCMLRAYHRSIVKTIVSCREHSIFIPALAYKFAKRYEEVEVEHHPRGNDTSKYSFYKLLRLSFDLMTGFTLLPLQMFTLLGFLVSGGSAVLVTYLLARRFILGPEAEGVFTLFAIAFFLISVAITGIGLIGEYIGRTYLEVQKRPRYVVREIIGGQADKSQSGQKNTNETRVVFFGYSQMGYETLRFLIQRNVRVMAVFSHEDDSTENIWFESVPKLALANGIPLYTLSNLKSPLAESIFEKLKPDLLLCCYYRKLLPQKLLNGLSKGAFNLHGSLLPKYRGRSPLNWAILNGETETGVTLHAMEKRADVGGILDQERVSIAFEDNALSVMYKLCGVVKVLLNRQLANLLSGNVTLTPQDVSQSTVFGGRGPEDGRIDWNRSGTEIYNLIRAVTKPYPGAFSDFGDRRLMIWSARPVNESPSPTNAPPGHILSQDPLRIKTGDGVIEIVDSEWVGLG